MYATGHSSRSLSCKGKAGVKTPFNRCFTNPISGSLGDTESVGGRALWCRIAASRILCGLLCFTKAATGGRFDAEAIARAEVGFRAATEILVAAVGAKDAVRATPACFSAVDAGWRDATRR